MKILIDNGHGIDTKGKRSPDGRLLEYAQNRLLAGRIVTAFQARGLDASLLVPEETDISLPERYRRVNEWCRQLGKDNVLLISIHCISTVMSFLESIGVSNNLTGPEGFEEVGHVIEVHITAAAADTVLGDKYLLGVRMLLGELRYSLLVIVVNMLL